MKIELVLYKSENEDVFYHIVDKTNNEKVGVLFTIENHIVYEVYQQYRGLGIATEALKLISDRINNPVLEIYINNIASKKVALKAGYKLVKSNDILDFYEYPSKPKTR